MLNLLKVSEIAHTTSLVNLKYFATFFLSAHPFVFLKEFFIGIYKYI